MGTSPIAYDAFWYDMILFDAIWSSEGEPQGWVHYDILRDISISAPANSTYFEKTWKKISSDLELRSPITSRAMEFTRQWERQCTICNFSRLVSKLQQLIMCRCCFVLHFINIVSWSRKSHSHMVFAFFVYVIKVQLHSSCLRASSCRVGENDRCCPQRPRRLAASPAHRLRIDAVGKK